MGVNSRQVIFEFVRKTCFYWVFWTLNLDFKSLVFTNFTTWALL